MYLYPRKELRKLRYKIEKIVALLIVVTAFWQVTSDFSFPFRLITYLASGYLAGLHISKIWHEKGDYSG